MCTKTKYNKKIFKTIHLTGNVPEVSIKSGLNKISRYDNASITFNYLENLVSRLQFCKLCIVLIFVQVEFAWVSTNKISFIKNAINFICGKGTTYFI